MISKNNKRVEATISKSEYEVLQKQAEYDDRPVSYLVARIIKYYIKNKNNISLE